MIGSEHDFCENIIRYAFISLIKQPFSVNSTPSLIIAAPSYTLIILITSVYYLVLREKNITTRTYLLPSLLRGLVLAVCLWLFLKVGNNVLNDSEIVVCLPLELDAANWLFGLFLDDVDP